MSGIDLRLFEPMQKRITELESELDAKLIELATAHKLLTDLQGCIIGAAMIRRLNAFVEENGGEEK